MQIGAALAGASKSADRFCDVFGITLGLAFQIQDDLFDLTLSAKQLGKAAFSDLSNCQHTVFTQYIFDHGTAAQKKQLTQLFGSILSEDDRPRIAALFTDSQALAHGLRLMNIQFDAAVQAVQRVKLPMHTKQELFDLVSYIRNRTS
jgi:geranylgeranyl pyrophosphate synthase